MVCGSKSTNARDGALVRRIPRSLAVETFSDTTREGDGVGGVSIFVYNWCAEMVDAPSQPVPTCVENGKDVQVPSSQLQAGSTEPVATPLLFRIWMAPVCKRGTVSTPCGSVNSK